MLILAIVYHITDTMLVNRNTFFFKENFSQFTTLVLSGQLYTDPERPQKVNKRTNNSLFKVSHGFIFISRLSSVSTPVLYPWRQNCQGWVKN